MKKFALTITLIMVLASVFASLSQAKVSDFNTLIEDNISAQKELHGQIRKQVKDTQAALQESPSVDPADMVVDVERTEYNTPTSEKLLKFKKEKNQRSVSRKKQMDRISQEFNDASSSF
ncbi:MAG: hypothetical protein ACK5Y2_02840 [Bdellovibrionales bacterium]